MKIEKIKNYNQKLLAILGTIGTIFLVIALGAFISVLIKESRRYNYEDDEIGILSQEKIDKLQKENKREQVISYESPKLIDTVNAVYIIPVSHKTLNEKEDIGRILGVMSSPSANESYKKSDNRYSSRFYGEYNNIIIYDSNEGTSDKMFDKRVNFNHIETEYFDSETLLLIKASEKDTYKDGVINLNDFKSLYIYSFTKRKIMKVGIKGMDVYKYEFISNSKDLIIRFGIDKNKDGQYKEHNEPTLIKRYDFESEQLIDIVDKKISSELQQTLEGTQK